MTEEKSIKKKIVGKTERGTEFSIHFCNENNTDVVGSYFEVEAMTVIIDQIIEFRSESDQVEFGLYAPHKKVKTQMEKLCIAAAASYPKVLHSAFIEEILEIPFNSYKVYATAKEHDSSEYLTLDDKKGISISLDGIVWLKCHLEKGESK